MSNLFEHVKRVAKDDVRLYFAPFKGALDAIKTELRRSSEDRDQEWQAERDRTRSRATKQPPPAPDEADG